ncbi:PAS domain S-box protein [Chloroflexota bacterium]
MMAQNPSRSWWAAVFRRPDTWFILIILLLITIPHYAEALKQPSFFIDFAARLGLDRHAFERILYLAPIVWAGFIAGWRGAVVTSLAALGCMLPRAIFISVHPRDAIFEAGTVFIIGNVLALSFASLRKERRYRLKLEATQYELMASEERYRELFHNAHEAIWINDVEGNITVANRACYLLTGYQPEELSKINASKLFDVASLAHVKKVEASLLDNRVAGDLAEVNIIHKNGTSAVVQLSTSPVFSEGQIVAFQYIARDITDQKRMQDNLHFYLQQVTRAQEEERKRISRELHDDTIQALVVLVRRLDTITAGSKALDEEDRLRLEELREQTNIIMQGVRRLSQDLRPAALDRLGLLPALEWLASDVKEFSGIEVMVNVVGEERRFPEEVELLLFRIVQEALRNVWRHSQASEAEISVEFGDSKTKVRVSDNGTGFDVPQTIGDLTRIGKLGLTGIQERVQLIGGSLTAQSQPGEGTSITVELPA